MGDELKKMFVVIGLKNDEYVKSLSKMRKDMKAFAQEALVIGGAITAGIGLSVKAWADAGHAIQELKDKTGMSATALSELKYAADMSGSSIESLEVGMKRMAVVVTDAANGSKTATDSLKNLDISVQDIVGKSPEVQLNMLLNAIAGIADPTARAAAAVDIFGRSGTDMLPMLAEGASGLQKMKDEASSLGIVFDDKAAKAAANFHDQMEKLTKSVDGLKFAVAQGVTPALTPMIDKITKIVTGISEWSKNNPGLSSSLATLTLGLGAFLTVGGSILLLLPKLIAGYSALNALMAGMAGPIGLGLLGVGMIAWGINGLINNADIARKNLQAYQEAQYINHLQDRNDIRGADRIPSMNRAIQAYNDALLTHDNNLIYQAAINMQNMGVKLSDETQAFCDAMSAAANSMGDSAVSLVEAAKGLTDYQIKLKNALALLNGQSPSFGYWHNNQTGDITGPTEAGGGMTQNQVNDTMAGLMPTTLYDPAWSEYIKNHPGNDRMSFMDWWAQTYPGMSWEDYTASHGMDWSVGSGGNTPFKGYQDPKGVWNGLRFEIVVDGQVLATAVQSAAGNAVLRSSRMGP